MRIHMILLAGHSGHRTSCRTSPRKCVRVVAASLVCSTQQGGSSQHNSRDCDSLIRPFTEPIEQTPQAAKHFSSVQAYERVPRVDARLGVLALRVRPLAQLLEDGRVDDRVGEIRALNVGACLQRRPREVSGLQDGVAKVNVGEVGLVEAGRGATGERGERVRRQD